MGILGESMQIKFKFEMDGDYMVTQMNEYTDLLFYLKVGYPLLLYCWRYNNNVLGDMGAQVQNDNAHKIE